MMKRAWLILADTLVIGVLLGAFTLFYLYPPLYQPPAQTSVSDREVVAEIKNNQTIPDTSSLEYNVTLSLLDELNITEMNTSETLSLEEIMRMSQEEAMREYLEEKHFQKVNLKKRLFTLHLHRGMPVYIRIFKKEALLEVWMKGEEIWHHVKDYAVCAYSGHLGPKLKEGDRQAPEGFYRVYRKQLNPHSKFHLAFNLGYPNAYDRAHHYTGSYLMVHGDCRSVGCYAMTDEKIEEIYGLVDAALKHGQPYVPVHIFPFRMEDEAMDAHTESRWYEFWMMLKEGYDYFEAEERPPLVEVQNGRYVIMETAD
jgi:murein L,D-transpeptidase YafK